MSTIWKARITEYPEPHYAEEDRFKVEVTNPDGLTQVVTTAASDSDAEQAAFDFIQEQSIERDEKARLANLAQRAIGSRVFEVKI
jgi:hypothetical protein